MQGHGAWFVGVTFLGSRIEVAIAQFQDENEKRRSPLLMRSDRDEYFLVTLPDDPLPLRIDCGKYAFKDCKHPLPNS